MMTREALARVKDAIQRIEDAEELTVIYYKTPDSVEIGVLVTVDDIPRIFSVPLKALLSTMERQIEFEYIFPQGDGPFIPGAGQERIAFLFGKPVVFFRRFGGKERSYLDNSSREVFQPPQTS